MVLLNIFLLTLFGLKAYGVDCNNLDQYSFDSNYTEYQYKKICNQTSSASLNEYLIEKKEHQDLLNLEKQLNGEPVLSKSVLRVHSDCELRNNQFANINDLSSYHSQDVTIFNDPLSKEYLSKDSNNHFPFSGYLAVYNEPGNGYTPSNAVLVDVNSVDGLKEKVEKELGYKLQNNKIMISTHHGFINSETCNYRNNDLRSKSFVTFTESKDCDEKRNCKVKFKDILCSGSRCDLQHSDDFCVLIPKNPPRDIKPVEFKSIENRKLSKSYLAGHAFGMIRDYLYDKRKDIKLTDRIIAKSDILERSPENDSLIRHRANTWANSSGQGIFYIDRNNQGKPQVYLSSIHVAGDTVETSSGDTSNAENFNPRENDYSYGIDFSKKINSLVKVNE